ncbi:MAG: hypothetical protein QOI36_5727, partial [Pseudonocardiales bacterium]|nr:hypothetical protein [Pseudonocardiales bacterium]
MSVRQIEVSRTLVFAAFRHAHGFFEALVTDYLDIACPEQGKLIFFRHPGGALAHARCSSHFKTKVITRGVDATVGGEDGDHRLLLEVLTRCPDGGGACAEVPQHPGIVR